VGPRGVLRCKATTTHDPTVNPRFGKVGLQTIEDTGPLTKKRMETIDDDTSDAAIDFMKRQQTAGKPFFCWFNSTRMHLRTHVRAEHRGRADITSNTYWDWIMNHVPQVYQGMEEAPKFVATFKEFPPRSVPQSFNPATILEGTLKEIKAKQLIERTFPMFRDEGGEANGAER
jgi:hypothetical protein